SHIEIIGFSGFVLLEFAAPLAPANRSPSVTRSLQHLSRARTADASRATLRPCYPFPIVRRISERSAARLAHQSGGLHGSAAYHADDTGKVSLKFTQIPE